MTTADRNPKRARLRDIIQEESLLKSGDFTLASGQKSSFFFDMKRTVYHPEGADLVGDLVLAALADIPVDAVGGLVVGAVPIVALVVAKSAGTRNIHGFHVRKQAKDHGTANLIDGRLEPGARVVMFEDVTTTGGSVLQAVRAVRERGCTVETVVTIVDRLAGAEDNLRAEGLDLIALFTREDFTA